jgi:hypothetical protein
MAAVRAASLSNVSGRPRRLLVAAAGSPEGVDDAEKLFKVVFIGPHLLEQPFQKKFPRAESFGHESQSDIM